MKPIVIIVGLIIIVVAGVAIFSAMNYEHNKSVEVSNNTTSNDTQNGTVNQTKENQTIITIQDGLFSPNDITIKTGTMVQWINKGENYHQITCNQCSFQSQQLNYGETYSFYFAQPGVYSYNCKLHPREFGKITVN